MAFNTGSIEIGAGTLYAAPLGTTEPTAVTGAWPSGWVPLGYTDSGNTWTYTPATSPVTVAEELLPVKNATTGVTATAAFSLAEATARNMILALNAGVGTPGSGTGLVSGTTGTNGDGSIWVEPPVLGNEVRIMLGWDSLPEAATSGTNPFGRAIWRQCFQTGALTKTRQSGANKVLITCTFSLEKPFTGFNPFREIYPAALSA